MHSMLFTKRFYDIPYPYKLLTFQYWIYNDSLFLSKSLMYLLLAFAYHVSSLISFSTINNISILVKKSNITLIFFKAACHANHGAEKHFAVSSSYISRFQDTYFESSQIHQLTITYWFEHTNHDILQKILFQNPYKLFLRARYLHQ